MEINIKPSLRAAIVGTFEAGAAITLAIYGPCVLAIPFGMLAYQSMTEVVRRAAKEAANEATSRDIPSGRGGGGHARPASAIL
jgi:hypothetical protein